MQCLALERSLRLELEASSLNLQPPELDLSLEAKVHQLLESQVSPDDTADPDPKPDEPTDRQKKTALIIKIVSIFVFLAEGFFLGVIPVFCKAFSESPRVLGIANAFSGGVFLAIALMHIMPEQVENWAKYAEEKNAESRAAGGGDVVDADFPAAYLLCISGYTLMLVLDRILFDAHIHIEDEEDSADPLNPKMSVAQVIR